MAEEKKTTKLTKPTKPTGGNSDEKAFEQITFLLAGLILLGAVATALLNYIESLGLGALEGIWDRTVDYFLLNIWPTWKLIAAVASTLALVGIINNSRRLRAINIEEQKIYDSTSETVVSDEGRVIKPKNEKWEKVIKYANSSNASDWRLAIIEADVMLEELLHTVGYEGESLGERLKSVDKSEFLTIEVAWEAHKIRNAIAHSGGDFQLNERETKRVIALFEEVFKEFQVI